jgi:hypothetical protein
MSGKRVRNTLVTYPKVRNNSAKAGLIPDVVLEHMFQKESFTALWEGPRFHQLVGEVTAHQGYDG